MIDGSRINRARDWVRGHQPHLAGSILLALVLVPALWFALAYGGLPRLWSHHERKKGKPGGDLVAFTAQDIPGDPINIAVDGPQAGIECGLRRGGWIKADAVSLASGLRIGTSVLLGKPYPDAPVSPLYVHDRMQDFAYQLDEGRSADRRHHVRFWQVAPGRWLASATFDRGVGLSLFTLQITHHIGPNVDQERDAVSGLLGGGGSVTLVPQPGGVSGKFRRNGGGDKYMTDGKVAHITLSGSCAH